MRQLIASCVLGSHGCQDSAAHLGRSAIYKGSACLCMIQLISTRLLQASLACILAPSLECVQKRQQT